MDAAMLDEQSHLLSTSIRNGIELHVARLKGKVCPALIIRSLEEIADWCEMLADDLGGPEELGDVKTE